VTSRDHRSLPVFAAKAGAKRVYAVEASGLAAKARSNVTKNGLDGVITVLQSKVEEVQIEGKVDIIISEWMVSER
jgi:protein arginine N-methyltransferase 3